MNEKNRFIAEGFFTGAAAAVSPQRGGDVAGKGGEDAGGAVDIGAIGTVEADAGIVAGSSGTPGRAA